MLLLEEPLHLAGQAMDATLPFTFSTVFTALTLASQTLTGIFNTYPENSVVNDGDHFDFIIIGAGTAGCVVANRLTEIKKWTTLIIDVGGDPPITTQLPGLFLLLTGASSDFAYATEKQNFSKSLKDERNILSAGKMLGGGSSMSYMTANSLRRIKESPVIPATVTYLSKTANRGNEEDFDAWGPPEWNYDSLLPYMKKLETVQIPEIRNESDYFEIHGESGPMNITLNDKIYRDIETQVLYSMSTLGYDVVPDLNGRNKTGWSYTPLFISPDGRRTTTADQYCVPASNRKNFYILKNTRVIQILFEGNNAVGVKVQKSDGSNATYIADLEVILSAGVFESPKLLMLSGIGPDEELKKHNIDVLLNLPVGRNFRDPPKIPLPVLGKRGVASATDTIIAVNELGTVPLPTVVGELENNIEILPLLFGAASPLMYLVCIIVAQFKTEYCNNILLASLTNELTTINVILHEPRSRGTITLKSSDPNDDPIVTLNYFDDPNDIDTLLKAVELMASVTEQTPYYKSGKVVDMKLKECKDFTFGSHEYYRCYIINLASSYMEPYGTCEMSETGVVDKNLKVHGVNNLRVIDASIIPLLKRGETQYVAILIGEKGSDLIKNEYGVL